MKQDLEILIGTAENKLRTSALTRRYFIPFIDVNGMLFGVVHETLDPRIPKARQQTLVARLEK